MKSWKERTPKAAISAPVLIGLLTGLSVTVVFAQEPQGAAQEKNHDLVIEEALDRIEKSIDPITAGEDLPVVESMSETPKIMINKDIPVEIKSSETVAETQEPMVSGEKVPEYGYDVLKEMTGREEFVADANISVDNAEDEDVMEDPEIDLGLPDEQAGAQADEPEEALTVKIIPLLHAEASSLIEMLQQRKSPKGEVTYNEKDRTFLLKDIPERLEAMSAFVKEVDIPLETETFILGYVKAKDLVPDIERTLTKDIGQVEFNEKENSIVVTDTLSNIGKIKGLIKNLDRLNVEIWIESRILQIVLNDEYLEGVDWDAIVSGYQKLALSGENGSGTRSLSVGTVSQEDYDILLDALDTVGAIQTVFEGNIKTENKASKEIDGLSLLLPESEIRFYLTPVAKKDKTLEVALGTQKEDERNVKVPMKDGATIVIGGLFSEVMVASTWKIPLLGDIPLLGVVFRNEGERPRKAEIITFLTVKTVEKNKL